MDIKLVRRYTLTRMIAHDAPEGAQPRGGPRSSTTSWRRTASASRGIATARSLRSGTARPSQPVELFGNRSHWVKVCHVTCPRAGMPGGCVGAAWPRQMNISGLKPLGHVEHRAHRRLAERRDDSGARARGSERPVTSSAPRSRRRRRAPWRFGRMPKDAAFARSMQITTIAAGALNIRASPSGGASASAGPGWR